MDESINKYLKYINECETQDAYALLSGTTSCVSPMYERAKKSNVDKDIDGMKKLVNSIAKVKDKTKSDDIQKSKGDIKRTKKYKALESNMKLLNKHASNVKVVESLNIMHDKLLKNYKLYSKAYENNSHLIILEYEAVADMLYTGSLYAVVNYIDVNISKSNNVVVVQKKSDKEKSIIFTTCNNLGKELKKPQHDKYINSLVGDFSMSENYSGFNEYGGSTIKEIHDLVGYTVTTVATIARNSISIFNMVRRSMFGILPLIRAVVYFRYNRMADRAIRYEDIANLLENNIKSLEKNKNIDKDKKEAIIKRQKAYIDAFRKRSDKIKAELGDVEKKTNSDLKDDTSDNISVGSGSDGSDDEFEF